MRSVLKSFGYSRCTWESHRSSSPARITVGTCWNRVLSARYQVSGISNDSIVQQLLLRPLDVRMPRPKRFRSRRHLLGDDRSITAERARRDGAGLKRVPISGSQNITAVHANTTSRVSSCHGIIIIITMATIITVLTVTR